MKAASSSDWYGTSPRHPVFPRLRQNPTTSSGSGSSSTSSLPRLVRHPALHHQRPPPQWGRFPGNPSSSSARYDSSSLGITSTGNSFSSSTGSNSTNGNGPLTNNNALPPPSQIPRRPHRQISKVLTPTETSTSSTSFSKSYSRSSLSPSNSTEPTAVSPATPETAPTDASTRGRSGSSSRRTIKPPFSFSPIVNKFDGRLSSFQQKNINSTSISSGNSRHFPGSSRGSSFSGNRVPPTPNFPLFTSETEVSETTDAAFTEEEEDDEEGEEETEETETTAEDYYDDEDEEDDQVYQAFKRSVKMLRVPSQDQGQSSSKSRSQSPTLSLRSVTTELEEDEEDLPPETVDEDEGVTTNTEGEEDDEEEGVTSSNYSSDNTIQSFRRFLRSESVPKTPVKVRVKVERASPHVHFDDKVKVTVHVLEEETEMSEGEEDDSNNEEDDEQEDEEEEEEEDDEEENSATESDATSTNTVETVRYLSRDNDEQRTEGESYGESSAGESGQSESEMLSEESGDEEKSLTVDNFLRQAMDKTDILSEEPRRTPMFPPITGAPSFPDDRVRIALGSFMNELPPMEEGSYRNRLLQRHPTTIIRNKTFDIADGPPFDLGEHGSESGSVATERFQKSETSVDSTGTVISGSSQSEATNSGGSVATATESTECSSVVTASNSDLSSRSQSARSSLLGRSSAAHKMYSVGGKLRSLSARRLPSSQQHHRLQNLPSPLTTSGLHQLSSDSASPSISSSLKTGGSSESSGSKQYLPDAHLGSLHLPHMLPPSTSSRSISASSSSRSQQGPFSASLRQLSLGNMQAMNMPYPKPAMHYVEEKLFKGEYLPPITPPSPSPSASSSSHKPRPLVRNLTYTVVNRFSESDDTASSSGLPPLPLEKVADQLTLRQLLLDDERPPSASESEKSDSLPSQHSLDEILFPSHLVKKEKADEEDGEDEEDSIPPEPSSKPPQVSFAATVIEHSLSSEHTIESSTPSEHTGSTQRSDSQQEESDPESYTTCRLTGKRIKKLTTDQETQLLNKDYVTFRELQQESIEEPDMSKDHLRHFALHTIRKQMEMERFRIQSMTEQEDEEFSDEYDFSGEEESGEDSSEEDEDSPKPWKNISHIPMAASGAVPGGEGGCGGELTGQDGDGQGLPAGDNEQQGTADGQDDAGDINSGPDESLKADSIRIMEGDDKVGDGAATEGEEDDSRIFMAATRINSAESGYRAMPPSRAGSTREPSLDPEEMEKEKERLIQEWKDSGCAGEMPEINASMNSTSEQIVYGGEVITINHSRPSSSAYNPLDALIQNGIDLTQELPGEEKKLAVVWEEFNRDEIEGGTLADYEFSTLLDEMIMDVNSYKPHQTTAGPNTNSNPSQSQSHSLQVTQPTTSTSWEQPKFDASRSYKTLSELVCLLSHNLRLVNAETLEDHMASLISLISSVLRKVRKNKTDDDYLTQIASLSAIRVLCDRLLEMTNSQNLKYADLSWLFRVLCKYSSDTDSKIRPEASFCLARLVKVAGPMLVVRPIYFILVMESEGSGKSTTGAKTKAAAIDTLTYAMLTFPKEDFHNLEEIAGWVCLAMLNEERRIRQSALECLAIIAKHLGGRDKALPLFHTLFLKEELDHFSRSPSPESTGKSSKGKGKGSDPVPLSVHGTVRLLTGPGFPIAQPIDAITARLDKDVLPQPSTKGLIEYAVNVPTGKDLVLLMTHMLDKDDDAWDFSSSTDSMDSAGSQRSKRSSVTSLGFSDIDWTGEGPEKSKKDDTDLISPDVAYILLGKGRVNKSDVVLLDTYKKEVIPEIIQLLNAQNKEGKGRRNRRGWWKNSKNKKKRKRKGNQRRKGDGSRPIIPTLSFDDDTYPANDDDDGDGDGLNDPISPVAVVVNPPPDDSIEETNS